MRGQWALSVCSVVVNGRSVGVVGGRRRAAEIISSKRPLPKGPCPKALAQRPLPKGPCPKEVPPRAHGHGLSGDGHGPLRSCPVKKGSSPSSPLLPRYFSATQLPCEARPRGEKLCCESDRPCRESLMEEGHVATGPSSLTAAHPLDSSDRPPALGAREDAAAPAIAATLQGSGRTKHQGQPERRSAPRAGRRAEGGRATA